jgi:hypothetical protein
MKTKNEGDLSKTIFHLNHAIHIWSKLLANPTALTADQKRSIAGDLARCQRSLRKLETIRDGLGGAKQAN